MDVEGAIVMWFNTVSVVNFIFILGNIERIRDLLAKK